MPDRYLFATTTSVSSQTLATETVVSTALSLTEVWEEEGGRPLFCTAKHLVLVLPSTENKYPQLQDFGV